MAQTSGAYGYSVALGYLRLDGEPVTEEVVSASFEVDVAGDRAPARVSLKAPFDPDRSRILC